MIARTWRGAVRAEDADAYLDSLEATGLKEYRETPGNRGRHRPPTDRRGTLRVLDREPLGSARRREALRGEDLEQAVFYAEDDRFLVDRDLTSTHYEVVAS